MVELKKEILDSGIIISPVTLDGFDIKPIAILSLNELSIHLKEGWRTGDKSYKETLKDLEIGFKEK